MTRRITQKEMKRDEFVETATSVTQWVEDNWQTVVKWAAVVAALVVLVLAGWWYVQNSKAKSKNLLAEGMATYSDAEAGGFENAEELETALATFERSESKAFGAPSGNTARFYQAATLHHLGRSDEAVGILEKLTAEELHATLRGSAQSLFAEVLVDQGESDRAISLLEQLAANEDAAFPPDMALLRLGKLHKELGNTDEAKRVWQRIVDEYPDGAGAFEANKLLVAP